jgi:hydroxyacylglutathione hydrolase
MKGEVVILNSFSDNYIYLVEYAEGLALAVDPGQAKLVLDELARRQLKLTHILATHRHADHIGGIGPLKQKTGGKVLAGVEEHIAETDLPMTDGQAMTLSEVEIRCIATPGHTIGSVCFYLSGGPLQTPAIFTGDTLFVCGCGRVFETDGRTMWTSLRKLAALPEQTRVYPGHDYTEENIRFALTQKPGDAGLLNKLDEIDSMTAQGRPSVPSRLADEKRLNPFLTAADAETFTRLRKLKDVF